MELAISHHDLVTVIAIAGSVDSLTAEQLTTTLVEQVGAGRVHLVCDFKDVNYTSSAGLRTLLGHLRLGGWHPLLLRRLGEGTRAEEKTEGGRCRHT